jgi:hypothetical protein
MKRIILDCPVCHKTKLQQFPIQILEKRNQIDKGIVGVHISKNVTCDHEYVIYIDMHFSVRDILTIDNILETNRKRLIQFSSIEQILKMIKPDNLKQIMDQL